MADAPAGGATSAIQAQLDSLSPRDRKLLTGLVIGGLLAFAVFLWWTISGSIESRAADVRRVRDTQAQLELMFAEYGQAAIKVQAAEERLAQYQGQQVTTFVEELASRASVRDQLRAVDEQGSELVGNIMQTNYKVDIQKVELQNALDFLYELETSGFPVAVQTAQFKTAFVRREKRINLTLELVAYSLED